MLAHTFDSLDDWTRLINRLMIVAIASWGAWVCWRKVLGFGHRSMVPKLMWTFPAVTCLGLVGCVTYLVISATESLSTWERNVYGSLLNWTILGLLGVIVVGDRAVVRTERIISQYRGSMDQAAAYFEQLDEAQSE